MGSEGRRPAPPLRRPSCPQGYTFADLEEIFPTPEEYDAFNLWMYGSTVTLCEGWAYNYQTEQKEPDACANNPHGTVTYVWDVSTYLAGYPQLD